MRYPIVIHHDKDSDFGVIVPDIPGCFSAGSTFDEALDNVREAIECHLEGLLLDNETLPTATSIDQHLQNPEFAGGTWALVDINLSQISGKAKRINITIPEKILRLIDLYTKNHASQNRSAFITDAALSYMAQRSKIEHPQHKT